MILLLSILLANPVIAEVDGLFHYGANYEQERQALAILERTAPNAPADYEVLWRLTRSYYTVGAGGPASERVKYFERGIEVGKRAVEQNPDGVEGHYWLAASWGVFLQEKGGLTAFRNVGRVRSELEAVVRLNDTYEEASAYTALGQIDRQLPGMFGGDLKRGIARLEHGLKVAPENAELKLALAEAYLDAKRKEEALRELREVVHLDLHSPRAYVERQAQQKAQTLLSKLERK
ncbi:MAG TPA: TRAP transporter TatT component family protein [Terriglobia bacterium]|jgi:tetratricopeptide (TPR) repeat protein|nr:TRAP transporter TatT component family protein [Terriglobia bacterium]